MMNTFTEWLGQVGDIVKKVQTIAGIVLLTVVVIWLIGVFWREYRKPQPVDIDKFILTPAASKIAPFDADGFTYTFADHLANIIDYSKSELTNPDFDEEPVPTIPELEAPGVGKLDIGPFIQWLKGSPAHLSGFVSCDGDKLYVKLRYTPGSREASDPFLITEPLPLKKLSRGAVNQLLETTAEESMAHAFPYSAARYYSDVLKRKDLAIKCVQRYLKSDGANPTWGYSLWGLINFKQGQYREAEQKYHLAIDNDFSEMISPDLGNVIAHYNYALLLENEGDRALVGSKTQRAQSLYNDAIGQCNWALSDRNYKDAYYLRAYIEEKTGDLHDAVNDYLKDESLDPTNGDTYVDAGYTFLWDKRFKKADEQFEMANELLPTENAYIGLGDIASADGNFNSATSNYLAGIKVSKDTSIRVYRSYADMLVRQGSLMKEWQLFENAIEQYDECISASTQESPNFDKYYSQNSLAQLRAKLNGPSLITLPNSERWALLGDISAALGDNSDASTSYKNALAANPSTADAWCGLAELAVQAHQPAKAASDLQRAVTLNPSSAVIHSDYAYLLKSSNPQQAEQEYTKASVHNDNVLVAYEAGRWLAWLKSEQAAKKPKKRHYGLLHQLLDRL